MDEWKRQLHSYKEENQRLKLRYQELEASKGNTASNDINDINEELKREISLLKTRIEGLEKELMNQEIELKAANKTLKDKQNDPTVNLHFNNLITYVIIDLHYI